MRGEGEVVVVVELGGGVGVNGVALDAGVEHTRTRAGLLEGIGYEQEVESCAKTHLQDVDVLISTQTLQQSAVFEENMATFVDGPVRVVVLLTKTVRIERMRAISGELDLRRMLLVRAIWRCVGSCWHAC